MKRKSKPKHKIPRIYVDANIIIEAAKQHFGTHDKSRENDLWFFEQMLQASEDGEVRLFTSSISIAECTNIGGYVDAEVQRFYKGMLTSGTLITLVQDSIFVAESARDLRWEKQIVLSGADLIHGASALDAKCTEMISWDGQLQGTKWSAAVPGLKSLGVAVIRPHETSNLPKRLRQQRLALRMRKEKPPKKGKSAVESRVAPSSGASASASNGAAGKEQ